jgi:cobalt-zinc-cadmium efflux system protein
MGLNLAFVGVEAWFAWRSGALSLWADAVHNLGDVAGLGLAWLAAWCARRPPDPRHTWGLQRAGLLAALANALLLMAACGALAWDAVQRLAQPADVPGLTLVAVAGLGLLINGGTALLFLRGSAADLNLRGAYLHLMVDALVSASVVVGGLLLWATQRAWIDPLLSLLIVVVVALGAWRLLRPSLHLLFDGVPQGIELEQVRRLLLQQPGVDQLSDLHVWATGSAQTVLTAHLVVPQGAIDDGFVARTAGLLQQRFGIAHVTLQVTRSPVAHGCGGSDGLSAQATP